MPKDLNSKAGELSINYGVIPGLRKNSKFENSRRKSETKKMRLR
jgi:hypothetical protein